MFTDLLGSVRAVTGDKPQSGTAPLTECYDYLPFGRMLSSSDNGRNTGCYPSNPDFSLSSVESQKFTGQVRDAETGLDYFGARYFSSAQGRFTSPDPMLASGRLAEPQSWNRYAYAGNNPLRYVDPTGLDYYDANGDRIGSSGDTQNYIITDKNQVELIKKSKTVVGIAGLGSAILLPDGAVIGAMGDAVRRSNGPTADDVKGEFHEEGGQYGLDSAGHQVAVASAPGPVADPQKGGAEIEIGILANPADAGRLVTVQGTFHVHPKGEIVVQPKSTPGAIVIGGTTTTSNFRQTPSPRDLTNAVQTPGNTDFVLGARTNRVYIYNSTGMLTPNGIPLKNFLKIGGK